MAILCRPCACFHSLQVGFLGRSWHSWRTPETLELSRPAGSSPGLGSNLYCQSRRSMPSNGAASWPCVVGSLPQENCGGLVWYTEAGELMGLVPPAPPLGAFLVG